MRLKFLSRLMVILLGAVALTAVAGGGDKDVKLTQEQTELMSILDSNQDGRISWAEAQAHPQLAERFRELDQRGNMQLDEAEFAQFEVTEEDLEKVRRHKEETDY